MLLARIARALGCAGYSMEECDAIMAWVGGSKQVAGPGSRCAACDAQGRQEALDVSMWIPQDVLAADDNTRFLIQGICLACRGRGFV